MKKKSQFFAIIVCLLAMSFVLSAESSQRKPQERQARQIFDATGLKGGLVVHIGCGDGKLTAALCANDSYIVQGLDANAENVEKAREHIRSLGLYGKVSARLFSGDRLPYADNLINLIVSEDLGKVPMDELMRVLAPNGVAYIKKGKAWKKKVKPWPEEIDEWTHWLHDATGNAVAQDMLVGPPRHLQWAAGPLWSRHHDTVPSVSAMVSSHGRLFYISDEAPAGIDGTVPDRWFLVARDGFNGVLLWKRAMPEWGWRQWSATWHGRFNQPSHLPGRLVAVGETIYVTLGFNAPLTALDAATGKLVRTYEGTDNTDEILYHEGLLVLALNNETRKPAKDKRTPINKSICVIEAETGNMLWKKGEYQGLRSKADSVEPFGPLGMVVAGGRIFLMDRDSVISLDLKTGHELWRVPRPNVPEFVALFGMRMNDLCVMVCHNDIVLYAQPEMQIRDPWHTIPGTLYAFSAKTGKLLWKHRYGGWSHFYQPDIFVIDNLVWIHEHVDAQEGQGKTLRKHQLIPKQDTLDYAVLGLDHATGEVKRRFSTRETFNVGHHHRCYRNKATARFLLTSRRGVEFLDTKSGENQLHHWVRGGCLFGIVPCNGLLYITPHPCDCYIATKLNGFFALAPESSVRKVSRSISDADKFERGPAYSKIDNEKSKIENPDDWPTYRHDPQRTGTTKSAVPTDIKRLWQAEIGGKLTPPVVADGKLFVASVDSHTIHAINTDNGKTLWTYTAAGRVDSPPTIYRGLVLFGSADGWIYCLTASDGKLAWRFQAAPRQRLVGAFGQLESAWPVNGSVLVKDGVAYVAAGRSSYLDQGVFLYLLDPETGKVAGKKVVYSPDPETDRMPPGDHRTIPGVLADILVSDGDSVYMRQMKVFGGEGEDAPHILSTAGFLDDSWFNRTQWSVASNAHGQIMVFDNESAYGVQAYPNISRKNVFHPGEKGYLFFASDLKTPSGRRGVDGRSTSGKQRQMRAKWSLRVPIRVMALVLADKTVFAAGTPDVVAPSDPLGAFEGRMGTVLCAFAASDGRKLAEYKLDSPPIFDGMIAANRRLYISNRDGRLICMGAEQLSPLEHKQTRKILAAGDGVSQRIGFGEKKVAIRSQVLEKTPLDTSDELESIKRAVKNVFDAALANDANRFTEAFHPSKRNQAQKQLQALQQIFSMTENLTFSPMIIMYDASEATVVSKQFKPNHPQIDSFVVMGGTFIKHNGQWKAIMFSTNLPNTIPDFYSYWQKKHPETKYWFDPDTPNWLRPQQNLQTNKTIEQLTRISESIHKSAAEQRKSLGQKVEAAAGGIEVFEAYFKADNKGAEKLDKWWSEKTKDGQVNKQSLAIIKNGLRVDAKGSPRRYRNEYIKWVGQKFISQAETQDTDAIDLLYHASFDPQLAYNCVYYGMSVIKPENRTEKILKRLTELAMADIATGRIDWGTKGSRQDILRYLQPYLESSDPDISARAQFLQKVFKGELDYNRWSREQYRSQIDRHFTSVLGQIRKTLAGGSSKQRRDALKFIKSNNISLIFDESFAEPLKACLLDGDPEVREKALQIAGDLLGERGKCSDENLALMDKLSKDSYFGVRRQAATFIGTHWIWNVHPQNTKAIDILIRLAKDKDHETRHNASYFGLSRIRDPNAVKYLIPLALSEQDKDSDTYKIICWSLKKNSFTAKEVIQQYIDNKITPKESTIKLYKDTFGEDPK